MNSLRHQGRTGESISPIEMDHFTVRGSCEEVVGGTVLEGIEASALSTLMALSGNTRYSLDSPPKGFTASSVENVMNMGGLRLESATASMKCAGTVPVPDETPMFVDTSDSSVSSSTSHNRRVKRGREESNSDGHSSEEERSLASISSSASKSYSSRGIHWTSEMDNAIISIIQENKLLSGRTASDADRVAVCDTMTDESATDADDSCSIASSDVVSGQSAFVQNSSKTDRKHQRDLEWKAMARTLNQRIPCIHVTSEQCWQRYSRYLDPELSRFVKNGTPWTPLDDKELLDTVRANETSGQRGGINWEQVCIASCRSFVECRGRYRSLQNISKKKGLYSWQEDAMLTEMWNSGKKFAEIGRAMNRPARSIRERHRKIHSFLKK